MILVPAAGDGTRFRNAGYKTPKHELPIRGIPMAQAVIDNVRSLEPGCEEIFVATQDWVGKTKGAVDTVVKAYAQVTYRLGREYLDEPLVLANCDQLVELPEDMGMPGNGIVFTFRSSSPAHSYVVTDRKDKILSIVEKPAEAPSDKAVSGVYYFPVARPFLEACFEANRLSGEQYISSALQIMLGQGFTLYAVEAPTAILGTPEDYERFQTAMRFGCGGECQCAC